jgi:hypothetical protein
MYQYGHAGLMTAMSSGEMAVITETVDASNMTGNLFTK